MESEKPKQRGKPEKQQRLLGERNVRFQHTDHGSGRNAATSVKKPKRIIIIFTGLVKVGCIGDGFDAGPFCSPRQGPLILGQTELGQHAVGTPIFHLKIGRICGRLEFNPEPFTRFDAFNQFLVPLFQVTRFEAGVGSKK